MSDDLTRNRSRRSLLVGALGGATALALGALSRPLSVAAVDGAPLIAGSENSAASPTGLSASQPGTTADVLHVVNSGTSGSAISAQAVPNGGVGVRAEGGHGVIGTSRSTNGVGVLGEDATGQTLGRGVQGNATNGWGVYAVSTNGQGLRVDGRATFQRAGRVTISRPNTSATVSVPGPMATSTAFPERPSLALAMLQTDVPGLYVRATTLDRQAGTLTIWLSAAPGSKGQPASVDVGWFIVN